MALETFTNLVRSSINDSNPTSGTTDTIFKPNHSVFRPSFPSTSASLIVGKTFPSSCDTRRQLRNSFPPKTAL